MVGRSGVKNGFLATMDLITVLIAETNDLLRRRLGSFLAEVKDIQLVGEAMRGSVLNRMAVLQPQILLLGVQMPKMDELKRLHRIRAKSPRTKILLLAEYLDEDFITSALQDTIHGCMLTTASPTELVKVIRAIHAGEFWVQRKLLTRVVNNLRQRVDELEGSPAKLRDVLSEREHEVVIWAVQGMTNKEIATQLGISAKTVKTHLQNVFQKLNVNRRIQLSALSAYLTSYTTRAARQSPFAE